MQRNALWGCWRVGFGRAGISLQSRPVSASNLNGRLSYRFIIFPWGSTMLTRFGWERARRLPNTNSSRRRTRRLRLEALEPRTLMVGDLFVSLQELFPINYPNPDMHPGF